MNYWDKDEQIRQLRMLHDHCLSKLNDCLITILDLEHSLDPISTLAACKLSDQGLTDHMDYFQKVVSVRLTELDRLKAKAQAYDDLCNIIRG